MFLAYSFLGASALLLIYEDVRAQRISLPASLLFITAALLKQGYKPEWENLWAAGAIALVFAGCQGLFRLFRGKYAMGGGDLLLVPFCGLWLSLDEIPSFLLSTGLIALVTGIVWRCQWGMGTFPMTPAILCGLGIVFLIRCFPLMNGI